MTSLQSKNFIPAAIMLLLFAGASMVNAQPRESVDVNSLGPQVGERVPDFELPDQNGRLHSLSSVMGPNGAMLLFYRSADW